MRAAARWVAVACGVLAIDVAIGYRALHAPGVLEDAPASRVREGSDAYEDSSRAQTAPRADGGTWASPRPPTPADRAFAVEALERSRAKALAKDFAGAVAELERARERDPENVSMLAELGWAAFESGDFLLAQEADTRAARLARDPEQAAQIQYNVGRLAEAKHDPASARIAYAESLRLRSNDEVRRRLDALTPPARTVACAAGAGSMPDLCRCLLADPDDLRLVEGGPTVCEDDPKAKPLGDPRLSVVRYGGSGQGMRVMELVAWDEGHLRPVAELGRGWEPGVAGVHVTTTVKGGSARDAGGRRVVVVRSQQHDVDMNLGGLEACTREEERETVCAIGEGAGKRSRCVVVAVQIHEECGAGTESSEPLSEPVRAELAERKKSWHQFDAALAWSVAPDGSIHVTLASGERKAVGASPIGDFSLFDGPLPERPGPSSP